MSLPSAILPPYAIVPIQGFVRRELQRRSGKVVTLSDGTKITGNYGIQYNSSDTTYDSNYKGPQSTWIRLTSNTVLNYSGSTEIKKKGFVLYGGQGFNDAYGIGKNIYPTNDSNSRNQQVLGYDLNGNPHTIDYSDYNNTNIVQFHRPPPGIESVSVEIKKQIYREAQITWKCWSIDQLNYMGLFFFTPYNTLILEWGWNNFDKNSLLDISNQGRLAVKNSNTTVNSDLTV